jgi:hypothetical protein
MPLDSELCVSLAVTAENRSDAAADAALELAFERPDSSVVYFAWDAPASPRSLDGWGATPDSCLGLAPRVVAGPVSRTGWMLAAHQKQSARFMLATYPEPLGVLKRLARRPHADDVEVVRAFWVDQLKGGTHFDLGDPDVESALAAARLVLMTGIERRGATRVPIGGPFHYRDVWLRDGARQIQALALAGHLWEAHELAAGLLTLQWPAGPFLSQRGQLDGSGQALWAFEQALLRPAPAESLGRFVDAAERAVRWCERQRALERARGPARLGLMPPCEPRDNELVYGRLVGSDAWTLAGYRSAARLARAAGRVALADSIERWRADYAEQFLHALSAYGPSELPATWDAGGRDWGNLSVVYPCAVLADDDARAAGVAARERALADRLWRKAGDTGLVSYGPADSLHGYLGADLAEAALLAGDRGVVDRALDAMLHWRSASGGAAELFSASSRDFGRNLPPHASCAAALVTLVRNSLLFDDGDRLMLTLGARDRWWKGSRVTAAPTRWGMMRLEFSRKGDVAEWKWAAVPVPTELRLPPGVVAASVEPPLAGDPGSDHVIAPPGTSHARVRVRPATEARP